MGKWFKRDTSGKASVLFRGNLQARPEEFASLAKQGIEVTPGPVPSNGRWSLTLRHATWGEATLLGLKDIPVPPPQMIEFTAGLTDEDKAELASAGNALVLTAAAKTGTVLRDRKSLLFFARAAMGDDGVGVVDHQSLLMWSRTALDDELQHGADLDINQVHCLHAVMDPTVRPKADEPPPTGWLHTHGLGELGGFDFDILRPSADFGMQGTDVLRAIAFAIVEGNVRPDTESFEPTSGGAIRFVPADEFQKRANPDDAALREADENHTKNRSVLCEPEKKRLFGGAPRRPKPSTFFRRDDYDGLMLLFSDGATELMEKRARATLPLLAAFVHEFQDLRLPTLVKLGFDTNSGGKEHPWFTVNRISGETIEGTCENEPFDIMGLKRGDRRSVSAENLTDWMIITPAGTISPTALRTARQVRAHRELIKKIIEESGE